MKKAIPLFLVGFMPYSVPLVWICLYAGAFGTPISNLGFCLLLLVPASIVSTVKPNEVIRYE